MDTARIDALDRVAAFVAETLGIHAEPGPVALSRVLEDLQRQPTWLVLDNCEPVAEGVRELVQAVLDAAPQVRLLTTSRAALGLDAEQVIRLERLDWPRDNETVEVASRHGAVAMFIARARAADHRLALDSNSVCGVIRLCEARSTLLQVIHDARSARFLEDDIAKMAWFNLAGVFIKLNEPEEARRALIEAEVACEMAAPRFVTTPSPGLTLCLAMGSAWLALQGRIDKAVQRRACELQCQTRASSLLSAGMTRLCAMRNARLAWLPAVEPPRCAPAADLALAALVMRRAAAGDTAAH